MADVTPMSQSCSHCVATVTNDDPTIAHPLDFLQALRDRGWLVVQAGGTFQLAKCPKCASSS